MLCTWKRYGMEPAALRRDAEKAREHRERSLGLLRVVDHVLYAASAASIPFILMAAMD